MAWTHISSWEVWSKPSVLAPTVKNPSFHPPWEERQSTGPRPSQSNIGDSSALWSKINTLLKIPQASTTSSHLADDFAIHFRSKVDTIRASTSGECSAVIANRQCNCLSVFRETTADEITKIVGRAPAKHCSLDPAPTLLVKRLMPLLAGTLAEMVNTSLC